MVTAEAAHGALYTPHTDLWREILVDFCDNIWVFDDEFQGYYIAGGMNAFICPSTADERRFLGIVGVGFGDGTSCNEGSE